MSEDALGDLTVQERRRVRAAVSGGQRLEDPRLRGALVAYARHQRDASWRTSLRYLLVGLPIGLLVGFAAGSWLDAEPLVVAAAVVVGLTVAELAITRPVRVRQARRALERHDAA